MDRRLAVFADVWIAGAGEGHDTGGLLGQHEGSPKIPISAAVESQTRIVGVSSQIQSGRRTRD